MATNVLCFLGGSGDLLKTSGGTLPLTLEAYSAAGASDLLLTVDAGDPEGNPTLVTDSGAVETIVKSSSVIAAGDLVCVVKVSDVQQLVTTGGRFQYATPIAKSAL